MLLTVVFLLTHGPSAHALTIIPTFDSSITNDPNAAIIESSINSAIQYYQARFSDPITVNITFQEITTSGVQGHSQWWYYNMSYSQVRTAIANHATTANDLLAVSLLPSSANNPVTGTSTIRVKTATLRALGFVGFNSGLAGGADGIIGLHVSQQNISRATNNPAKFDLITVCEHEMDEVLGLASSIDSHGTDPFPEDLFRYDSTGFRNFTTNGDNAYFSIDGTNLLARFNQNPSGDYGDWWTAGAHTPQVQDQSATLGATPQPNVELIALDVIGYTLLPPPQPVITNLTVAGSNVILQGTNGLATGTYYVLTSTNLTTSRSLWSSVATNMLNSNGNFTITATNAVIPAARRQFFALRLSP